CRKSRRSVAAGGELVVVAQPEPINPISPARIRARTQAPKELFGSIAKIVGFMDMFSHNETNLSYPFLSRSFQTDTVTRKKVAGIDVAPGRVLLFWRLNKSSSSFCRSAARPFFSAASKAFIVGP